VSDSEPLPDADIDSGTPSEHAALEPAQGILVGAYYGDQDIEETQAKLGRELPLHLTYYAWTDDWTTDATADDLSAGRIPFVNWELYEGGDLDQIIAGDFDEMLAERAESAAELGERFFLDLGAEMNGEWSPWSGAENGMSADKYVAMYRHVHDAFAAASNVVWVWCPNVTDEPREQWNLALNYYPGDEYVDWTCVDGYNWGDTGGGGWQSFDEVFQDIYPLLAAKNKPIMIGEMASAESGGDKAAWIEQILPTLESDYPLIKGLIWFDVDKETDWRISSSPEAEAAFEAMVNDPYFNP
jgi:beta-mannanase